MDDRENPYAAHWHLIREVLGHKDNAAGIFGIERLVKVVIACMSLALPVTAVRCLGRTCGSHGSKVAVEIYSLAKVAVLLMLLTCNMAGVFAILVAGVFLYESFTYQVGGVLMTGLWSAPVSIARSLILLWVNFWEYVVGFAVLYLASDSVLQNGGKPLAHWYDALYFSAITFTTVGYGDFAPATGIGKGLVLAEVFAFFVFVTAVVANIVGALPKRHNHPGGTAGDA